MQGAGGPFSGPRAVWSGTVAACPAGRVCGGRAGMVACACADRPVSPMTDRKGNGSPILPCAPMDGMTTTYPPGGSCPVTRGSETRYRDLIFISFAARYPAGGVAFGGMARALVADLSGVLGSAVRSCAAFWFVAGVLAVFHQRRKNMHPRQSGPYSRTAQPPLQAARSRGAG